MSILSLYRRGLLVAGSFAFLTAAAAQQQPAPAPPLVPPAPPLVSPPSAPAPSGPPGFSPMDQTKVDRSGQDANLKPHPVSPIATSVDKIPVAKIKLPAGFKAEIWSSGHPGGRTMVMGDKGTMFMGTRVIGRVYAITDKGGKREAKVLLQGLTQPNGLAFANGSLYVFAINKVYRYDNIEDHLDKAPEPVELTKNYNLPDTIHHNWKYVAIGPDGKMYVQVGSNCNICETNPGTTARSGATISTAPASRSWRAASATQWASTGIR